MIFQLLALRNPLPKHNIPKRQFERFCGHLGTEYRHEIRLKNADILLILSNIVQNFFSIKLVSNDVL